MSEMESPPGDVRVGTAGYNYAHWRKGVFYPRGVTQTSELRHYSGVFSTVEINATFHAIPKEETLRGWQASAKSGFVFALKAPQAVTHVKRLANLDDTWAFFVNRARESLGKSLGPILIQLPPSFHKNVRRIHEVAAATPPGIRVVFEFRSESWYTPEVYDALRQHNMAVCENISLDHTTHHVDEVTADFTYTRFHKSQGWPEVRTDYDESALDHVANVIVSRRKRGLNQFLFFLNDHDVRT